MCSSFELRLGHPWPMKLSTDQRKSLYASRLLEQLREKRDSENGCPASELERKYSAKGPALAMIPNRGVQLDAVPASSGEQVPLSQVNAESG